MNAGKVIGLASRSQETEKQPCDTSWLNIGVGELIPESVVNLLGHHGTLGCFCRRVRSGLLYRCKPEKCLPWGIPDFRLHCDRSSRRLRELGRFVYLVRPSFCLSVAMDFATVTEITALYNSSNKQVYRFHNVPNQEPKLNFDNCPELALPISTAGLPESSSS